MKSRPTKELSFVTLLLMISFASVNAVLFTPALPEITNFFAITENLAQRTITWFMIGYALGQLLYGPIANRFGRKPALYCGIGLQIFSCFLCIYAGVVHQFELFVIGRLMMALGAGVGLKMAFTLVTETYPPKIANRKLAYLISAFAITPGLSIMIGGYLCQYFGWTSTFYASACYGLLLLCLCLSTEETKLEKDLHALQPLKLFQGYASQFMNIKLLMPSLLMGCITSFVYVFAATAPFIAINSLGMAPEQYGTANVLPPIGLLAGSLLAAEFTKKYTQLNIIKIGMGFTLLGVLLLSLLSILQSDPYLTLFTPVFICYFGISLMLANVSSLALSHTSDKANGSAVMNFINMGFATTVVLCISMIPISLTLLASLYSCLCFLIIIIYLCLGRLL